MQERKNKNYEQAIDRKVISQKKLLSQIETASQQRRWEQAIEDSLELVDQHPELWQGYWSLGQAYKNLAQYDKAESAFKCLHERFPKIQGGLTGQIDISNLQKDWSNSITLSKKLVSIHPELWQGYWLLGQAYKNLAQYDKAEATFKCLHERFPKIQGGLTGQIDISNLQKDWSNSITLSKKLVSIHPELWQGYWLLGQAYKNLAQYDKAEATFKCLHERFPKIQGGLKGQIEVSNLQKDWSKSIALSEEFIKNHPHMWHGYFWKGRAYLNRGSHEYAMKEFKELDTKFPSEHHGLIGMVDTFKKDKNWHAAINLLLDSKSRFKNLWLINWHLGVSYKALKEFKKAETCFIELDRNNPEITKGLEGLVSLYNTRQDYVKSESYAKILISRFPEYLVGYELLGNIYTITGYFDKSNTCFNTINSKFPEKNIGIEGLIRNSNMKRDYNESLILSTSLIDKNPYYWKGYWLKAQILLYIKDNINAVYYLNHLVTHFPSLYESYLAFIYIEKITNNGGISNQFLDNCSRCFQVDYQFYENLSNALNVHGFYEKSKDVLFELIKNYPDMHLGLLNLIKLHYEIGEWRQCFTYTQQLTDSFPELWDGYLWKIKALIKLERYSEAEQIGDYLIKEYPVLSKDLTIFKEIQFFKHWDSFISVPQHKTQLLKHDESNKIKVKLFAIAKDEAAYIPQWIYHHLSFGFDAVEIWINRTTDNSEKICKKISQTENNFFYRVVDDLYDQCEELNLKFQYTAYDLVFRKELREAKYTHIMFLDLDELWMSRDFETTIRSFISNSNDIDTASFPWFYDQPNYNKKPFDTYISETLAGKFHNVVKSLVRVSDRVISLRCHNAITKRNSLQILQDQSKFSEDNWWLVNNNYNFNITPYYNSFKHAKEILSFAKLKEMEDAGVDFFVYHQINKSQIEYISSLYRGNEFQEKDSLKENRFGYVPFEKPQTLNINKERVSSYKSNYKLFVFDHGIGNEIKAAQQFVLNRFNRVESLVKENKSYLSLKMFKGVTIL
ncbi:tetratricopeptide repeat protein [Psychrobacter immobilis]|uniref:tetratricopeptide repeat protein n=1 Tax=Psychrobacter immobilis TaxID=498 RepID=UPI001917D41F|nr:tetratricopeptide repeat protein [Psychrobacter immobilis]